ncbi:MAG: RNA polymerase sigma factor [Planctomycetota bacterium]|nr:RNA polymerase sigma factor [Planctomycetota bacterium]
MGEAVSNAGNPAPSPDSPAGSEAAPGVATKDLPELALVQRVARKDASSARALELLFVRHGEALARFLARSVRGAQEVEDLVHDAFVRVAEKASSFRGESPFRTWLFSLALNLLRSRKRRASLEEKADETILVKRPELAEVRPEADPSWDVERRELWEKVEEALGNLAEPERETFMLYWFGKLPYSEISRITGVSVSAAKVRVHRALSRLSQMLGGNR